MSKPIDIATAGIDFDYQTSDVGIMFIALIVACHKAGGTFEIQRSDYVDACLAMGLVPGQSGGMAWSQDRDHISVTFQATSGPKP